MAAFVALTGCSGADAVDEPLGEVESAATGPTCSAQRARGAVNKFQKGMHDAIAFAEGTRGVGNDGYNIGFAYKRFSSCARHPNVNTCRGICSTASGRYQFLKRTWDPTARAIGASTFEPENQERGAQYLIAKVRRVTVPATRAMTAAEFTNALNKLSYEWASLPPGRYGQPVKTRAQLRSTYCAAVGGC
ncbi:MAG: glycoside hydrolase family 104 protein [Labilithrix sp.]|nr:glycoside hydrolase family 104 protein [Labilithrix sp.]